ncbi:MAG: DsbC family protein [Steroidobacteraceae bacterium]
MNIRLLLPLVIVLPLMACAQGSGTPPAAIAAAPGAAAQKPAEAPPATAPLAKGDPRIALSAKLPGTRPEDLRATPIPGIFELSHGADISYVTADAKFVFSGDLYQVSMNGDFPNLTEVRRREMRAARLAAIPESQMLVFGPATAPHTITVFTDIDCPWCQRLHSQIAQYNQLGIRVRYLFYPRTGPDTESWYKADAVWCSANRNEAFTRAKNGEDVKQKPCPSSPVKRDYELGQEIGVTGTPGVVLENGELVPGYLAPKQMLAHITESLAQPPRAQ